MALICEDDIALPDPVIDLDRLRDGVPRNCDILYCSYLNGDSPTIVSPAIDRGSGAVSHAGTHAIFPAWACGGTQCYLLTAKGAAKVLKAFRPIRTAVDGFLTRFRASGGLETYALRPMAASHADFPSTIR